MALFSSSLCALSSSLFSSSSSSSLSLFNNNNNITNINNNNNNNSNLGAILSASSSIPVSSSSISSVSSVSSLSSLSTSSSFSYPSYFYDFLSHTLGPATLFYQYASADRGFVLYIHHLFSSLDPLQRGFISLDQLSVSLAFYSLSVSVSAIYISLLSRNYRSISVSLLSISISLLSSFYFTPIPHTRLPPFPLLTHACTSHSFSLSLYPLFLSIGSLAFSSLSTLVLLLFPTSFLRTTTSLSLRI